MKDTYAGHPWDHRVTALAHQGRIKLTCVQSTHTVQTFRDMHQASTAATIVGGRLIMGAQLLSAQFKNASDALAIKIKCDGPFKGITVISDYQSNARAFPLNPQVDWKLREDNKIDLNALVGSGTLEVIKDTGLKTPYSGMVNLISGGIAEDLTYYLAVSEQIPSIVALDVSVFNEHVAQAGGLLVQVMPEATEEDIAYLEKRASGFPDISYFMSEGFSVAQICDLFMGDPDIIYLDDKKIGYRCSCTRDRMSQNLITLGAKELKSFLEDPEGITLECHFCDRKYLYSQADLQGLIDSI